MTVRYRAGTAISDDSSRPGDWCADGWTRSCTSTTRPSGLRPRSRSASSSAFRRSSGFHTLLGIAFAFLLNFNRVAVLLGVYSNLPWVIAPYYAFRTMVVGAPLTGHRIPPGFRQQVAELFELSLYQGTSGTSLMVILSPFLLALLVGSLLGAVVLAAWHTRWPSAFVRSRRQLKHLIHSRD